MGISFALFAWLEVLSAFWLILPVVGLAVLIQRHDRVIRARDATARAISFYTNHLGFHLERQQLPAFANVSLGDAQILLSGPRCIWVTADAER